MDPFIVLNPYNVLVYSTYRYTYLVYEVATYLQAKYKKLPPPHYTKIVYIVRALSGLYCN